MRRRTLLALPLLPAAAARAQTAPLRVGLAPYLSPAALLTAFRPLTEHLQRHLGQPVETYTARDFLAISRSVRDTEHDLALVPAHLGRVALSDWRWQPLARTVAATSVVVIVRGGGQVRRAADLRDAAVGMLDPLSLTAAVGARWLAEQGLDGLRVVALPSINSALIALERDEVAAVVAAATQLLGLPPSTPGGQRTLARLDDIPGPVWIARPGTPPETAARWRDALLAFVPDPARAITAANARPLPLAAADLDTVEPYAADLRRQLARP